MSAAPVLWDSVSAATATGGRVNVAWNATGISIDSRSVAVGDLFIAIEGPAYDGHDFIADAFKRGAAAAMVAKRRSEVEIDASAPLLEVDNTLDAMAALGAARRGAVAAKVVAVTGSVGKTGSKEALRMALRPQGATHASASSLNNHWGVPLSLARMSQETAFGVFEIGMNHAGEITPLSRLVRPHVALITAIAPAHLWAFANTTEIADAKAEVFAGLEPGGVAVLNRDTLHFERLRAAAERAGARVVGFGESADADVRLLALTLQGDGSDIAVDVAGVKIDYRLGAPGKHWALNSLGVLAVVGALEADLGAAAAALAEVAPAPGRGERHQVALGSGGFELIDESYNANPASVRAALDLLAGATIGHDGRRIAVLGDMLELGEAGGELHAELADEIRDRGIDLVFACGPLMARMFERLPATVQGAHTDTSDLLKELVQSEVTAGDVVMVKGSLGMRMAPIVGALKQREAGPPPLVATG